MSFENNFTKIIYDKNSKTLTISFKSESPLIDKEFQDVIDSMDVFYKGCEKSKNRFKLWFDVRNLGILNIDYYKRIINFFKENELISENYLIGTIIVSNNIIINTIINNILKLHENKRPLQITDSEQNGLDFLNELE